MGVGEVWVFTEGVFGMVRYMGYDGHIPTYKKCCLLYDFFAGNAQ